MTNEPIGAVRDFGACETVAIPSLKEKLGQELAEAGCFEPAPWPCGIRIALVVAAYGLGFAALLSEPDWPLRISALILVAFASVQAGFIAHDASDGAITKNRIWAYLFGQFFMTFLTALSASYFSYFHKVHHAHLSDGGSAIGMASTPLNEYEGRFVRKLVSGNGLLFTVVMVCLRGFTFKLESLRFIIRNRRATRVDQVLLVLHIALSIGVPLLYLGITDAVLNYALVTLFAGPYIGTILLLNHTGMAAARTQTDMSSIQRVSAATRNLGASWWSDFVFGGVNNHIEHHLFPDMPTARLPMARKITRDFCQRHGIAYQETDYFSALAEVTRYFRALPQQRLAAESLT